LILWHVVWPALTSKLAHQGPKNKGIPSACLILVSDEHAVSTSFEHRSCRQSRMKLWTC